MSGIRTHAAAELLGVSPNTLRSWERRFDYPRPQRTAGGHRQYDLSELEALRRALLETHNISSAIEVARRRGEGPSSSSRLLDAFDRFDEAAADRVLEESLAVRSVERTVEDVLLSAVEMAKDRPAREAELDVACRWATGWLYAQRRIVPPAGRSEAVVMFDASDRRHLEALHVQALELALRRAGHPTVMLSLGLAAERAARAMRACRPSAFVFCGGEATLEVVGRLVYAVRQFGSTAPVLEYRESMPVTGDHSVPSLGTSPTEAVRVLRPLLESWRAGQRPSLDRSAAARSVRRPA